MLKEIRCTKFNEKVIKFKDGLNVVLGDQLASNSIGKTTMLMIIDFVFGGETYVINKQDAIEALGHHRFCYKFDFDNKEFYFARSTDNYRFIEICDQNYTKIKEISINEYKTFIEKNYKLDYLGSQFRSIVGNYSRIWGKDNYYVDKPLKQKELKNDTAINNLIKLFNRYQSIDAMENQLKKIENKKDAINKAIKNELIPSINKTQYLNNQKNIEELNKKIERFKKEVDDINLNLDYLVSNEILELREEKSKLSAKRNLIENKIKRIEANLNSEDLKVNSKMNRLIEFFPTINIDKLKEINNFHKNMSNSLKAELKDEIEKLYAILEMLKKDIDLVEKNIEVKTNVKDIPSYNVERLTELLTKKNNLEQINAYYEEKQKNKGEVESVKKDLNVIKSQIISEIVNVINITMYELFNRIYTDGRNSPVFNINGDSYSLKRSNDTGTGSSYINLIAFDLSIFTKTDLPFLIHDSILFKNIELSAFENLISIYNSFKKQVFISIDEVNRFSKDTKDILEEKACIKLDRNNTLFIKNWKIKT